MLFMNRFKQLYMWGFTEHVSELCGECKINFIFTMSCIYVHRNPVIVLKILCNSRIQTILTWKHLPTLNFILLHHNHYIVTLEFLKLLKPVLIINYLYTGILLLTLFIENLSSIKIPNIWLFCIISSLYLTKYI